MDFKRLDELTKEAGHKCSVLTNHVLWGTVTFDPSFDHHANDKCKHKWKKEGPIMPYHFTYFCTECGIEKRPNGEFFNKDGSVYTE